MKRNITSLKYIRTKPVYHTIDKERNMCLTHLRSYSRDDPDDSWFLFDWNGNEYEFVLHYSNPRRGCIIWSVSLYEKNFIGNEEFVCDLKDALTVYGIHGWSNQGGIEVNVELEPSVLEIESFSDMLKITFLKDNRFTGRMLAIKGETLSLGFDAYPSSMKWLEPYENEEIDSETRALLVRKILRYKSPTGFKITMHQTQETNKGRTRLNILKRIFEA